MENLKFLHLYNKQEAQWAGIAHLFSTSKYNKGFCFFNLYKSIFPQGVAICHHRHRDFI